MNALGLLILLTGTSTGAEAELSRIVRGLESLPSLELVQAWSVAAMGLASKEEAESWATRARLRGLVPRVGGRIGSDANVYVKDSLGDWAPTTSDRRGLAMRVEARFEFGDLVFSDLELRANREAIARSAAERLVLEEVTRLYFERVEVWLLGPGPTAETALRAAALDGLLRAYTGGRYELRAGEGASR